MVARLISLLLVGGHVTSMALGSMICSPVSFEVPATAQNPKFVNPPDAENGTAVVEWLQQALADPSTAPINGTITVSGTFYISGTYCRPPGKALDVIQLLLHGVTYTRSYWTGLGGVESDIYNWPLFAARQGYATLNIDRLGHGESNHQYPDSVEGLSEFLHVEIVHGIIAALRKPNNPLGRAFKRVVLVGHSNGSSIGVLLVAKYKTAVDAFVATAFSIKFDPKASPSVSGDFVPASKFFPSRFASVPPGYITLQHESVRQSGFYFGGYDPAIPPYDFATQDTLSVGEAYGAPGPSPIPGFKAPVMVVNGAEDQALCNPEVGVCDAILNATGIIFPDSVDYSYYAAPNTGHDVALHYSAPKTFAVIHDWLDSHFGSWGN